MHFGGLESDDIYINPLFFDLLFLLYQGLGHQLMGKKRLDELIKLEVLKFLASMIAVFSESLNSESEYINFLNRLSSGITSSKPLSSLTMMENT
ncbi:hypothetical protein V6N11_043986 [Hibiscus sabdariffa]|uniref:Uncharacterized protein n=1 Tax=Hibiscus sabdariffa TaxID=183260 RepID=A0ABR2RDZ9_9ROSI